MQVYGRSWPLKTEDLQQLSAKKKFFVTHVFAFLKFGFFMSGTMSDNFSAAYDSVLLCISLHIIYTQIYKFETSFSDISGSTGPILIKFTQLFQQVI